MATVTGNYKSYSVILRFNRSGELDEYKCNCQSSTIWRGACKHVIAALLAVLETKDALSSQSAMDRLARKLSDSLEKQIYREIDESFKESGGVSLNTPKLRIVPKLFLSAGKEPFLNFYVGNSRMYIIKNINEFVSNINNLAYAEYGSKLKFRHSAGAFDEDSRGLLEFIMNENAVYYEISRSIMNNYNYMYMTKENARNLALNERNTDDFFGLCLNKALDSDKGDVKVLEGPPSISFEVESGIEEIILKGERLNLVSLNGKKYKYILYENVIYRTDKNRGAILTTVTESLNAAKTPYISFKDEERVKFISIILPYLQRERFVSEVSGELENAKACPMFPNLYFEAEGDAIICRVSFCYGDVEVNPLKSREKIIPRDLPYEYRIIRHLRVYGFEPDENLGVYRLYGNDDIYRLLQEGLDELKDQARIYATDEIARQKSRPMRSKMGVRLSGDMLEMTIDESEYSFVDLIDALESVRLKKKYHRLKDGRFIDLEDENTQAAAYLVNALDLSEKDVSGFKAELPKFRSIYIDQLTESNRSVNRSADFQRLTAEFKHIKDARAHQPALLRGNLREYQKTGFNWLVSLARYGFGGILADDMGLGKTIQIIAFLLAVQSPGARSLIVSPTSLIFNWENEIIRFAPSLTAKVINGVQEKRKDLLDIPADIYITTYDMLKRDSDLYKSKSFETLIADEAQYIKNPQTQNAKAIKAIKSKNRFALTGTPIENSLTELWSIFDFIMPGYLYSLNKFIRLYETPIVKNNETERAEALRKQISPFLLRRMKKDVLTELPEKIETNLYAEMPPDQRKLYSAYLLKARGLLDLDGGISRNRMKILAELTRLRQICCHPALFIDNYEGGSGKLTLALETIQMTVDSGHRLLLFSQFTSMLSILINELNAAGLSYFYLDGGTSASDRMDMANRFNKGDREIFLISLKAGGTGLNLIGADVVIHYDPWWNPAVMDQASDRAHRYGQKHTVQVFNLVTRDTIEQKIMDLHNKKKNLVDSVISEGGQFLSLMTEAEVKELFNI
ncbi:MAG: DEAD/DEAH box helicase [Clostridiales bacterium]|nr:DEAD/DEAH box helicase [Clostridiales bacterium]